MTEPTSLSFLEHAIKSPTQYSEGWRQVCQELLDARARVAELVADVERRRERERRLESERDHARQASVIDRARVAELEREMGRMRDLVEHGVRHDTLLAAIEIAGRVLSKPRGHDEKSLAP